MQACTTQSRNTREGKFKAQGGKRCRWSYYTGNRTSRKTQHHILGMREHARIARGMPRRTTSKFW